MRHCLRHLHRPRVHQTSVLCCPAGPHPAALRLLPSPIASHRPSATYAAWSSTRSSSSGSSSNARSSSARSSSSSSASTSSDDSRVYLLTGSTDGIGRHTALRLAQTGATVLVHGRNPQRVADTVAAIQKACSSSNGSSGSSGGSSAGSRVCGYTADLSSLQAVRELAAAVVADHPQLTALVNNAGVYEQQRRLSTDGYEMTWAVNVLAPFLLTSLLWRHVEQSVVTTASISAASHIDMNNLQQERGYSAHSAYSLSKLCDIIFTLRLHQWLEQHGSSIMANTLDPGTVNTKMLLAGWGRIGIEVGQADNTFKLLTDSNVAQLSGKYFVGHRGTRPPSVAEDPDIQRQLWQLWTQQTGAVWQP